MFKNYLRVAWRNLYRNKLHTAINLGGLTIGFTIGIIILLVVYAQFTFDHFHENGKRIYEAYQVINKTDGQEITNQFGFAPAPIYKKESQAIEKTPRILDGGNHVRYRGKDLVIPIMMVDEDFFPMFSFPILTGNQSNPLANLSDVVLSENAVKKIFGNILELENAAWIADSGRFMACIKEGIVNEVEPVGRAYININSVTDFFPWKHALPEKQK